MSEQQETPREESQQATTEKRERLMRLAVARGLLLPFIVIVAIIFITLPKIDGQNASWSWMLILFSVTIGVILLINIIAGFFNIIIPVHLRIERGKRKKAKRRKLIRLARKLLRKREREEL